jgi:RNA polymerase sigma-70 factor (ECF subfamily)
MTQADVELMERIRAGDPHAFDRLFGRQQAGLLRHLARLVRDDAAAEDLLQEVFLRVWTRAEQWEGRGSLEGWLRRIATNLALNYVRTVRRRRQRPLITAEPVAEGEGSAPEWMFDPEALDPAVVLEEAERYERLRQLVGGLTEEKREVLRLVYESEMDISSAAGALGVPEGTVKSRLHSARKQLAREWEAWERGSR